jgi:glucose-6-phosphate dehydrogenase assembly protein OpcA
MSITIDIERELAALREADRNVTLVRTSTMTHLAWVPEEWLDAALTTLSGLSEQHPSRTILLVPLPDAPDDVEYDVRLVCFVLGSLGREVCSEVITLRLGGRRVEAAASLVLPLLRPNLPVFIRWRGRPPFGNEEFESLVDVVDRLVVDSSEWSDLPYAYRPLVSYFDKTAVSDIAWARGEPWRLALADLWPGIADLSELSVRGPYADALLLAGWLESRLARRIRLQHEAAAVVERVAAGGRDVEAPDRVGGESGSELLSRELERLARDRVYEQATWVCAGEVVPTPTPSTTPS